MKSINKMFEGLLGGVADLWFLALLLVALVQASIPVQAQHGTSDESAGTPIAPSIKISVEKAQVRTREDMERAEADEQFQAALGLTPQEDVIPFRPTMDASEYEQAKAAARAGAISGLRRPKLRAPAGEQAPPELILDGEGVDQTTACGTCRPPDTHGAAGAFQFVEITNQHVDVFERDDLATLDLSVSLASFFDYTTRPIFDPRVVYDATWNRWVISAEAFPESPTVQFQFLAVSETSDASGPYFLYRINVNFFENDDCWDFPQLGMDQDSIIITANVFGPGDVFRGARTFAVAKARLYNGLGFSFQLFANLCGTLAPPIVLDKNPNTFLVCAPPQGTTVTKYTMTDSSRPDATALTASTIGVPFYSVPEDAPQPGTSALLDTLDSRFVNASTQIGDSLWQVHSIGFDGVPFGIPTLKFYEFDTVTDTIKQSDIFFASNSSNDFNASIAVDPSNSRAFVTWTSTDPNRLDNLNAQVRFGGCKPATPKCTMDTTAPPEFTSSSFYRPSAITRSQRWGDYSAVTIDPNDPDGAFLVNEYIINPTTWGTRIAQIRFEAEDKNGDK